MELPKNIKDEILEYCRVNDISGVDDFIIKMVKQGFTSEKFGSTPWEKEPEVVEKEVIKEVEKIVEKEVPVEIIKEVPVEVIKEVHVTDDEANLELQKQIEVLEAKIKTTIQEYEDKVSVEKQRNSDLGNNLHTKTKECGDRGREILKLTEELNSLKEELEIEKNKPKQKEDDIYGENKKGFFGSNISDIWKKNK